MYILRLIFIFLTRWQYPLLYKLTPPPSSASARTCKNNNNTNHNTNNNNNGRFVHNNSKHGRKIRRIDGTEELAGLYPPTLVPQVGGDVIYLVGRERTQHGNLLLSTIMHIYQTVEFLGRLPSSLRK